MTAISVFVSEKKIPDPDCNLLTTRLSGVPPKLL